MQVQSDFRYIKHVKLTDAFRCPHGDAFTGRTICYRHRLTDVTFLACYILQSRKEITGCAVAQALCKRRHIIPMGASRDFLSFFFRPTSGGQTPQPILTQNGSNDVHSRKADTFAVKTATFHTPWSPGPLKGKILQIFGLKNFCARSQAKWGWEIEICSYILHRGYMSRDTRMRNDYLALCLWAHDVWGGISQKPLEIETWVQRITNRKWTIASPMVTWPMTSRDLERSRSWPQYVWCPLSQNGLR